jgi:hypothetical protein
MGRKTMYPYYPPPYPPYPPTTGGNPLESIDQTIKFWKSLKKEIEDDNKEKKSREIKRKTFTVWEVFGLLLLTGPFVGIGYNLLLKQALSMLSTVVK